jgi:hypothetical protein
LAPCNPIGQKMNFILTLHSVRFSKFELVSSQFYINSVYFFTLEMITDPKEIKKVQALPASTQPGIHVVC